MKFYGTPNQLVSERRRKPMSKEFTVKPIFRFDTNGEYETNDERLCRKLMRKFAYEETKQEDVTVYTCKKCGFTTDKQGVFLAHHRQEHPKKEAI